jgi:DNA-binding NtrC family response regulator
MEKATVRTALVVDDEALIRWSLSRALRDRGCDVVVAADAQEALRVARAGGIDIVLLDLRLPDSEDLGLLTRLRALVPTARVILMTAFGTAETKAQAVQLGASAVVDKPFTVKALVTLALGSDSVL